MNIFGGFDVNKERCLISLILFLMILPSISPLKDNKNVWGIYPNSVLPHTNEIAIEKMPLWKLNLSLFLHWIIVDDNRLFCGSRESNIIYCINENDGSVVWTFDLSDKIRYLCLIDSDLFAVSADNSLYCFDSYDGKLLWRISLPIELIERFHISPTHLQEKIYIICYGSSAHEYRNATIICVDKVTSSILWNRTVTLFPYGMVYDAYEYGILVPLRDGELICLDPDTGGVKWKLSYHPSPYFRSYSAVSWENRIYWITNDTVKCLDGWTGNTIWRRTCKLLIDTSEPWPWTPWPCINALMQNGRIFAYLRDLLCCLDLETGSLQWKTLINWFEEDMKLSEISIYNNQIFVKLFSKNTKNTFIECFNAKTGGLMWAAPYPSLHFMMKTIKYNVFLRNETDLLCINGYNGSFLWSFKLDGVGRWAIDENRGRLVVSDRNSLYCFEVETPPKTSMFSYYVGLKPGDWAIYTASFCAEGKQYDNITIHILDVLCPVIIYNGTIYFKDGTTQMQTVAISITPLRPHAFAHYANFVYGLSFIVSADLTPAIPIFPMNFPYPPYLHVEQLLYFNYTRSMICSGIWREVNCFNITGGKDNGWVELCYDKETGIFCKGIGKNPKRNETEIIEILETNVFERTKFNFILNLETINETDQVITPGDNVILDLTIINDAEDNFSNVELIINSSSVPISLGAYEAGLLPTQYNSTLQISVDKLNAGERLSLMFRIWVWITHNRKPGEEIPRDEWLDPVPLGTYNMHVIIKYTDRGGVHEEKHDLQIKVEYPNYSAVYGKLPENISEYLLSSDSPGYPDYGKVDTYHPQNEKVLSLMIKAICFNASKSNFLLAPDNPYNAAKNIWHFTYFYGKARGVPPWEKQRWPDIMIIDHFIANKEIGDCTQFADLVISLLRAASIPARYVVGQPLDLPPLAHAWVEAWLNINESSFGWVQIDAFNNGITPSFNNNRAYPLFAIFWASCWRDCVYSYGGPLQIMIKGHAEHWEDVSHNYATIFNGIIIKFQETRERLYIHIYDEENNHVGINYETNKIEVQINGAQYFDDLNGTVLIFLPLNHNFLKSVIDARYATNNIESFNLTIMTYKNGELMSQDASRMTISKGDRQEYFIKISPDAKTIKFFQEMDFWKKYIYYMICFGFLLFISVIIFLFKIRHKQKRLKK